MKLLSGLLGALLSGYVSAAPIPNALVLDFFITSSALGPLSHKLEDELRAETPAESYTLIIDSPGGEVLTGLHFMELMGEAQSRGTKFHCIVPHMAISMAFSILLQCDTREALDIAQLLWHHTGKQMGNTRLTNQKAFSIAKELSGLDELLLRDIRRVLSPELTLLEINTSFDQETMHYGLEMSKKAPKFITSRTSIPNVWETVEAAHKTAPALPGFLEMLMPGKVDNQSTDSIQIIYIQEKYLGDLLRAQGQVTTRPAAGGK